MFSPVSILAFVAIAALSSLGLTLVVERSAARWGLVKTPNARSSHTRLVARGGGLGIVIVSVVGLAGLAVAASLPLAIIAGLGLIIAALGFADDLKDLPAAWRFPVQALCVAGLVIGFSAIGIQPFASAGFGWGLALSLLAVIAGTWWLNLYNFMDGVDGIAASQAILILGGGALIWLAGDNGAVVSPILVAMLIVLAGCAGFLIRNMPPARIFMGDVASTFLAFVIFGFSLVTIASDVLAMPSWLILVVAFTTDATITLLRRIRRGEPPTQAHRRHAYQQLSRRHGHLAATLSYAAITGLWAVPLAALANRADALWAWGLVGLAYVPIAVFVLRWGGGAGDEWS